MPSVRLILSEALLCFYLLLVYFLAMSETRGIFLPGSLGAGTPRLAANIAVISFSGAAGMAAFAFGFRRLSEPQRRRAPVVALCVAAVGWLLLECFPGVSALLCLGTFLALAGWGFLMAFVLYRVATETPRTHFGRFIGVSHGLAAVLDFAVGAADAYFPALPFARVLALPCLGALAFLLPRNDVSPTDCASPSAWQSFFPKSRAYLVAGVALLALLQGLCDSVTLVHFSEYAPSFPASRLFYAAGLLAFGWLADRKFSVMPAVVLIVSTYFMWFRAFHEEAAVFLPLSQFVETIHAAPIIVLVMAASLHIAARSDRPERWAVMSRLVELPLMSVGLVLGIWLWPLLSLPAVFAAYTTLLLVGVALLYRASLAYTRALTEAAAQAKREQPENAAYSTEKFEAYCRQYELTEQESIVLFELLKGAQVKSIAEMLFVTERTARFHISNLLRKTGAKTQLELVSHFYRSPYIAKEHQPAVPSVVANVAK